MANPKASTSEIALKLSRRASGVTALDLKKNTGSKSLGAMAATLARIEKRGEIKRGDETRQSYPVFLFVKDPPPKPVRAKKVAKKTDGAAPLTVPKRGSTTLATALKMARRPRGVTVVELKKRLNSKTLGPMSRSLLTGVRKNVLQETEDTRRGHTVFKATGKSLPRKPRKTAAKRGRPKKAAKRGRPKKAAAAKAAPKKSAGRKASPLAGISTLDNADFVVALGKALEVFGQELARIGERKR